MAGGFLSGPKVGNFHHFRKVIPLFFVLHGEVSLQSLNIAPLVQEISGGGVFFFLLRTKKFTSTYYEAFFNVSRGFGLGMSALEVKFSPF